MTSVSPDSFSTVESALRAAPWSPEAEQAVLGAMLLDQDAALRAAELLDYGMFYREAHRRLFRAMLALTEQRDTSGTVAVPEGQFARAQSLVLDDRVRKVRPHHRPDVGPLYFFTSGV